MKRFEEITNKVLNEASNRAVARFEEEVLTTKQAKELPKMFSSILDEAEDMGWNRDDALEALIGFINSKG